MADEIADLDQQHVWHPFTQMRDWCGETPLVIESGEGTDLIDTEGRRYIDGVSSLWCNVHGHRHPLIDQAVRDQLERVAHSTMLGLTHPGGAELAARLVDLAPPGLSRVFYSDSGSTAVEIALKMAFQYWQQRGGQHARRTSFVRLTRRLPRRHARRRSQSAASTSSTAPTSRCCSDAHRAPAGRRGDARAPARRCTARRSPR